MQIKGIEKTSLIDFPGRIASVVFTGGCPFSCPYCHNPELTADPDALPTIPDQAVLEILSGRSGFIDGVCITGGEPTVQPDLGGFIEQVRRLGLEVKLDTNGSAPQVLGELFERGLLDYVAMDVKAPPHRYAEIVRAPVSPAAIRESVDRIRCSAVPYEFRTTVVPTLLGEQDLLDIAAWLDGSRCWVLQGFRPLRTLDERLGSIAPYPAATMYAWRDRLASRFDECLVRNVEEAQEGAQPMHELGGD